MPFNKWLGFAFMSKNSSHFHFWISYFLFPKNAVFVGNDAMSIKHKMQHVHSSLFCCNYTSQIHKHRTHEWLHDEVIVFLHIIWHLWAVFCSKDLRDVAATDFMKVDQIIIIRLCYFEFVCVRMHVWVASYIYYADKLKIVRLAFQNQIMDYFC